MPDEYLTREDLDRIIKKNFSKTGLSSVDELIAWFEDGRRDLLRDHVAAAKELEVSRYLMQSILASQAFRQAYFYHVFYKTFSPEVLQAGMQSLVEDFISGDTLPRDRLAIFRAIQELFGIFPTQKVEQTITNRSVSVNLHIVASPDDFKDNHEGARKTSVRPVGELESGTEAESRRLDQVIDVEVGEGVPVEVGGDR